MNKKQQEHKINRLMALMLFAVFAVCILFVLLTGARIYKQLTEQNQKSYDKRTAIQYLTTKIRQNDHKSGIEVCRFEQVDALVLKQKINEKTYETYIYCYDGYLREIFTSSIESFSPEDGEKLLEAEELVLQKEGNSIRAKVIVMDGNAQEIELYLRSGEEDSYEK